MIDTKLLKQKILDLAIRGKLVPQDPNDEPASVLLERIRAEKKRLVAEGKIKRSKSTTDNRHYENVPFEVPESWEWSTLAAICSKIGSGSTPRGSNYTDKGIPFFRSQNVYNDGIAYDDIKYISEEVHQSMISTEVLANDVLLNITGGSLGRCAIVPRDFEKGNVSQHVCILRPIYILPEYLHGFILSSHFSLYMEVSGSGREGLPKYNLEKMFVPIPPLAEQHRIVSQIESWFALIEEIETNKQDLQEAIKQAKNKILSLAISGRLVAQDPNDVPAIKLLKRINPEFVPCDTSHYENIPLNWCVCMLKDIFEITMGSSPGGNTFNREQTGMEFHQGKTCFTEKYVANSDIYTTLPTKTSKANSIILCVRAPVGVVNIAEREICIGRGLCALYPKQNIDLMFAFYALQTYQSTFNDKGTGTTFKAIGADTIRAEFFLLPPYNEQIRIRKKLDEVFDAFNAITKDL